MTWEVPRGKFIAVTGPSGVGKSSLLACLAGLLRVTEGKMTYCCNKNCLHHPSDYQNLIGIIFQNLMLIENNTVLNNVLCGRLGRYRWWKTLFSFPKKDLQQACQLLEELGIETYTHRWVAQISGGEQQRTAIARALFQEPEIFLADEPVSHLDPTTTHLALTLLRHQARLYHRTVFCVLHDSANVKDFADIVLQLDATKPEAWNLKHLNS